MLGDVSAVVVVLSLLWQTSLVQAGSSEGCWLSLVTSEVADSHLVLQSSPVQSCSLSGSSLIPAPVEFTPSLLLR